MKEATILIADPRDAERTLLGYLLSHEGFVVHLARSAAEAVEISQSKPLHVILLDVDFWQGAESNVLATLKNHPQTKELPVVLFGESRSREDLASALASGAAQWVTRNGFDVPAFLSKIRTVLEQPRPQKAIPAASAAAPATSPASATPPAPASSPVPASCEKLTAEAVAAAFSSPESLAPFEFNILDAINATCSKDQTPEEISRIALRDPLFAVALLNAANASSEQQSSNGIVDLAQAIQVAGTRRFYILAESMPPLDMRNQACWSPAHFWVHSVATARIAGLLSTRLQLGSPASAVTAGLLHDVGRAMLATRFAPRYQLLMDAARSCDSPSTEWERQLIGLHHGEIAAHAFKHLGLPQMLRDVVLIHHDALSAGQAMKITTRLIALIVQAADQIGNAVFCGDFPLTPLTDFADECATALENANVSLPDVLHEARAIIGELTTEMTHWFPRVASDAHFYIHKPIHTMLYFAPAHKTFDLIRVFFEVRSHSMLPIMSVGQMPKAPAAPVVVNLSGLTDTARQVEALTSVMASGLMRSHKGLVLLPTALQPVHQAFASENWQLLPLPTHPARWMPWLAEASQPAAQPEMKLSAA